MKIESHLPYGASRCKVNVVPWLLLKGPLQIFVKLVLLKVLFSKLSNHVCIQDVNEFILVESNVYANIY